jgi:hypothetical protein
MGLSVGSLNKLGLAMNDQGAANEINDILDAVDELSAPEVAFLDGVVAGTSAANKAVVVDANKRISDINVGTLSLGAGAGTAVDRTAAQINLLAHGAAAGYKLARGQHTTVAGSDTVVTGLTTVVTAMANLESNPAAGDAEFATAHIGDQAGTPAAGSILIKTWKHTTGGVAGNPDLVAATAFSKLVNWVAIGT